jgi:SNF2 family DNA or RNA helicase
VPFFAFLPVLYPFVPLLSPCLFVFLFVLQVLDEAQAIKSFNSMRWQSMLNFKARNRLLLTGTPIQNSLTELWSLLHFIMVRT